MVNSAGGCASSVLLPIVLAALGYALLVHQLQEKLIYMPRTYATHPLHYHRAREAARASLWRELGGGIEEITYALPDAHGSAEQTAYFVGPAKRRLLGHGGFDLWVATGGNAGLALDWLDLAAEYLTARASRRPAAFLLVDYPGYGRNQGTPSPESMLAGSRAALRALERHLGRLADDTPRNRHAPTPTYRLHFLAHSIGCSVALAHAAAAVEQRQLGAGIVLVAPFTTMIAMAERTLPIPIPRIELLLRHPFDNPLELARLGRAIARDDRDNSRPGESPSSKIPENPPPRTVFITILHGDRDNIVPVEMGRDMAARVDALALRLRTPSPLTSAYVEVEGAGHNDILRSGKLSIFKAMGASRPTDS